MVLNNNNKKFIKTLSNNCLKANSNSACNRGTGDDDIHKGADVPPGRNQVYGIH